MPPTLRPAPLSFLLQPSDKAPFATSQPHIVCTWTTPQRGLARETSHLYCFWLAVLITGTGSQIRALCEWDLSFQAFFMPCSCSPRHSSFHGCLEELLLPTCVQRPEDLPFSLQLPPQLIYNEKLKQVCRACLGAGFPSVALPPRERCREASDAEEPQAACTGQLGPGAGKPYLCNAAPELISLQEEPGWQLSPAGCFDPWMY